MIWKFIGFFRYLTDTKRQRAYSLHLEMLQIYTVPHAEKKDSLHADIVSTTLSYGLAFHPTKERRTIGHFYA